MSTVGPLGIPVIERDYLPDGVVLLIGSCTWCTHTVGTHDLTGCTGPNCDCTTPLSRLVKLISTEEGS